MTVEKEPFGILENGREITRWTMRARRGIPDSVSLIDYGAAISSVRWEGTQVCLGMDDLQGYRRQDAYLGATCGRYANRIHNGEFILDGERFTLQKNDGDNSLHGGNAGFSHRAWKGEILDCESEAVAGVGFELESPHMEGGYPGNLKVRVEYYLSEDGYLYIYYRGGSDRPTVVNLTNHAYWNLSGESSGAVYDHRLQLHASGYVDVDSRAIPNGTILPPDCGRGAMDFTSPRMLREVMCPRPGIEGVPVEASLPNGIDHCYVVDESSSELTPPGHGGALDALVEHLGPRLGARLEIPGSRSMEVYTSYPGIQVYTGNFLDIEAGRDGKHFSRHGAVCLETQHFPDAPNQPSFPSTVLRPGEVYEHLTVHRFSQVSDRG